MAKRITERDEKISNFIEETPLTFATVNQIGNIFFGNITYSAQNAQKRLKALEDWGHVKRTKAADSTQFIYYSPNRLKKQIRIHEIVVGDFYAKLLTCPNIKILKFEVERIWNSAPDGKLQKGSVLSDAFCILQIDIGKEVAIYSFIIEHQKNNKSWKHTIEKYNSKLVLTDISKATGQVLPSIILIDDIKHSPSAKVSSPFMVTQMNSLLTDFSKIFMEL